MAIEEKKKARSARIQAENEKADRERKFYEDETRKLNTEENDIFILGDININIFRKGKYMSGNYKDHVTPSCPLFNKCFIITAITSVAPEVSPDTFAAASDVL